MSWRTARRTARPHGFVGVGRIAVRCPEWVYGHATTMRRGVFSLAGRILRRSGLRLDRRLPRVHGKSCGPLLTSSLSKIGAGRVIVGNLPVHPLKQHSRAKIVSDCLAAAGAEARFSARVAPAILGTAPYAVPLVGNSPWFIHFRTPLSRCTGARGARRVGGGRAPEAGEADHRP